MQTHRGQQVASGQLSYNAEIGKKPPEGKREGSLFLNGHALDIEGLLGHC